jgi:hypothetical protein
MTPTPTLRLSIFLALAAVMAATRLNHFGAIPDASWAMFFVAGFYLREQARWAFPALMVVAVAVDAYVITASGMNFWSHYCVSPGYWFLLPAYFSLWAAGTLVARFGGKPGANTLGLLVVAVFAGTALCHLFAQGGFYWLSDSVAAPTVAGWAKNYADWFLPYLRTTGIYVGLATVLHVAFVQLARTAPAGVDAAR